MMAKISNKVLAERIDTMIAALGEVKEIAQRLDDRLRQLEKNEIIEHSRLETKIDSVHRRLNGHDIQFLEMLKAIEPLEGLLFAFRILSFIGSALGISVIALIWALITGQARINFSP